jgi:hypothetical protein
LHCSIPTGMVMWMSPCDTASKVGAASVMSLDYIIQWDE